MDEGYRSFLNGIIKEDKYWGFVCTSGRRVVYEDDEDAGSSDSEIEVWDDAPHGSEGNPTPFVYGRGYIVHLKSHSFGRRSWAFPEGHITRRSMASS